MEKKKTFEKPEFLFLGFQAEDVLGLSESNLGQYDKTTEDGEWELPVTW